MAGTARTKKSGYDIIIGGGGYVGLSIAVAIASQAPHMKILIADAAPESALEQDQRASAIAAAATRMLDILGVWKQILPHAQPINEMIVTDSKLSDVVRPVFLTFGNDPQPIEQAGVQNGSAEPFAHMVPNKILVQTLRQKANDLGIIQVFGSAVEKFEKTSTEIAVSLRSGDMHHAKLLVAADGVRSKIRDMAGIKTVHWPYDQWGIVTTVAHERDHHGRAEEHFLPAGPFAILPLKGRRSSLVWTESQKDAKRILEMDDISFELELEQRFGHKLGEISVDGPKKGFPLGLTLAREYAADRIVLAGDAAHGIHPIAGQGLNLGFKDAAALAETLIDADRLGLDIGSLTVLERYQLWRRFDTVQMGIVTDVLNRIFSNDNSILRIARDVGLGMVEKMPWMKKGFIARASGNQPGTPKLLRGETI